VQISFDGLQEGIDVCASRMPLFERAETLFQARRKDGENCGVHREGVPRGGTAEEEFVEYLEYDRKGVVGLEEGVGGKVSQAVYEGGKEESFVEI
jgi:hypothetical protein